jgi:hypothetical protein
MDVWVDVVGLADVVLMVVRISVDVGILVDDVVRDAVALDVDGLV